MANFRLAVPVPAVGIVSRLLWWYNLTRSTGPYYLSVALDATYIDFTLSVGDQYRFDIFDYDEIGEYTTSSLTYIATDNIGPTQPSTMTFTPQTLTRAGLVNIKITLPTFNRVEEVDKRVLTVVKTSDTTVNYLSQTIRPPDFTTEAFFDAPAGGITITLTDYDRYGNTSTPRIQTYTVSASIAPVQPDIFTVVKISQSGLNQANITVTLPQAPTADSPANVAAQRLFVESPDDKILQTFSPAVNLSGTFDVTGIVLTVGVFYWFELYYYNTTTIGEIGRSPARRISYTPADTVAPAQPGELQFTKITRTELANLIRVGTTAVAANDGVTRRKVQWWIDSSSINFAAQQILRPDQNDFEINLTYPGTYLFRWTDYDAAGNNSYRGGFFITSNANLKTPPLPPTITVIPKTERTDTTPPLVPVPSVINPPSTNRPARPTITSISSITSTGAVINVPLPASGDAVTSRHWKVYNGIETIINTSSSPTATKTVTGLTTGTPYFVEVYDINANGNSIQALSSFTTT